MRLGGLPAGELRRLLEGPGLRLDLGCHLVRITSDVAPLRLQLAAMYAHHEVGAAEEIDDAWVSIRHTSPLRRFVAPSVVGSLDGRQPFLPLRAAAALVLLEGCLNWSVVGVGPHYLLVHAAALERNGRAVILPATSGSGKSTLCAALVARGWRLLSDETALLDLEDGRVLPIPKPISLKNESIAIARGLFPAGDISEVFHGMPKGDVAYVRPPAESVARRAERAPPAMIVTPRFAAGEPFSATRLRPPATFQLLVDNSTNYGAMMRRGFDFVRHLAETCPAHAVRYGALDPVIAFLEEQLRGTAP